MSIIKNPIILALLASALVFTVTYCYFNYSKEKKDKKGKKLKKKSAVINETMILSAAITGLITWYVATSYFVEEDEDTGLTLSPIQVQTGGVSKSKVPNLESECSDRSYNLLGSGVNIPKTDLKIPNVLIDYK